jgi:hypothetical protein
VTLLNGRPEGAIVFLHPRRRRSILATQLEELAQIGVGKGQDGLPG